MELRLEKLKRRDLRHLLPIEAAVFPEPWSVGVFHSELALRHGRLYRAAWHGDQMAGYIGFMIVPDEAHITTIATAPAYQRGGVARTPVSYTHLIENHAALRAELVAAGHVMTSATDTEVVARCV